VTNIKDYRFSDEREWRFCPTKVQLKGIPYLLNNTNAKTATQKKKFNLAILSLKLQFNPDDISYIIIKNDSEIIEIIRHLENVKGNRFSHEQIRRLTTRILTFDQINTGI